MTRTLPLRVAPAPGEVIDSWLEAIADRYATPLGVVVHAVGLQGVDRRWGLVRLDRDRRDGVAERTGIDGAAIDRMTLSHYDGTALAIDYEAHRLKPSFPFGSRVCSRYCPQCLDESGGRWQLCWRLGWAFACTRHRCLLSDVCPKCGQHQRRTSPSSSLVPRLGRCATAMHDETRCGGDLTTADIIRFPPGHPVIDAQKTIFNVIADNHAGFGIYAHEPQAARSVLTDLKALTSRALMHASVHGLDSVEPQDLVSECANHYPPRQLQTLYRGNGPCIRAPALAVEAAVGMTAALTVLQAPSIGAAGDRARWLGGTPSGRRKTHSALLNSWARDSEVIAAILIKAQSPLLSAHLQVRCRSASPVPALAVCGRSRAQQRAARLPSLLWPAWSLRLTHRHLAFQNQCAALACATLLVGSTITARDAAVFIGSATNALTVRKTLAAMQRSPQWAGVCMAIVRLADYLDNNEAPIDYRRRRQADYSALLPERRWREMCWKTGALAGDGVKIAIVRSYLFEMITGMPARSAPYEFDAPDVRGLLTRIRNLPYALTPELAELLRYEAEQFLAANQIDEPLTWQPPARLLDGLDLPGPDPDAIDIVKLHRLVAKDSLSIGQIAKRLDTNLDTVRYLLGRRPVDTENRTAQNGSRSIAPIDRLRATLTPQTLNELYIGKKLGLSEIGRMYGVRGPTVKHVALLYQIPLRPQRSRPSTSWLIEQRVIKRRTADDIAAEIGYSASSIRNWCRESDLDAAAWRPAISPRPMTKRAALALINVALTRRSGWQRLQRFTRTLAYPTIAEAAEGIGVDENVLRRQIKQLEEDFGGQLLMRARSGLALRPTPLGGQISEAVRIAAPVT
jgi:hypothetical protein